MTQQQTKMCRAGLIIGGIGVFFALAALPPLHPVAQLFLKIAYWPIHSVPDTLTLPAPLLVAISGGLTAGLGGMLWALGRHVAPIAPEAATRVAQISAWSWFATDSAMSVAVGAPFNAVLNLSFLALIVLSSRPAEGAGSPGHVQT